MTNGVVHWEIGGHDLDKLTAFYEQLFGWKPTSQDENYRLVEPSDGLRGGLMRCRDGTPPYVTVYVAVDDLPAVLSTVGRLGGSPLVPPTPVPDVGAFALFRDPEGNVLGLLGPDPASRTDGGG